MRTSAAWLGLLQEGVPEEGAPLPFLPLLTLSGSHSLQQLLTACTLSWHMGDFLGPFSDHQAVVTRPGVPTLLAPSSVLSAGG